MAAGTDNAVLSLEKSTIATVVSPGDYFVYEMKIGCESLETICIDAALHDAIPGDLRVASSNGDPAVRVVGATQNADVTVGAYDATAGTAVDVAFNETSPRFPGIKGIEDGQKISVLVSVQLLTSTPLSKPNFPSAKLGMIARVRGSLRSQLSKVCHSPSFAWNC